MALVSPGVSVTITDESFFIPASAPTVPLIFIATADEKVQSDGVTPAEGTYESEVIRTITSLKQSVETYGIPNFLSDPVSGAQHHGDARNEYGLFALNQYLGIGNRAYVLRTSVNLNDDIDDVRTLWDDNVLLAGQVLNNLVNEYIDDYNAATAGSGARQVATVTPVDDASIGSPAKFQLEGKYFTIDTPTTGYYVWYQNSGAGSPVEQGVDPAPAGRTGILVTFDDGDDAATIAALTQAAVDANSNFNASVAGSVVTITNAAIGAVSVAPNAGTSTFTVNLVTAGADATATISAVTATILKSLAREAMTDVFNGASFDTLEDLFFDDASANPLAVYANGYNTAATGLYNGFDYEADNGTLATGGSPSGGSPLSDTTYTPGEGEALLNYMGDSFKYTVEFRDGTSLGANDAARRTTIATAFAASINSNTEIRSENFDYNLVLCPGYPEVADELVALVTDIKEEALVLADTPMDLDPDGITNPSTGWAATTSRQRSTNIAYYYPSALASNLDGVNVAVAASGVALRTIAYNDDVAFLWFAPAGLRRGLITGVTSLGYVDGALGGPTSWVEVNLNQGQRDALYQYAPSGDINPLVFFPGDGFVVWGQKTSASAASALDRINVARLMMYIKRQLRRNTNSFVFQPNDQLTRDNLKAVVDGFLGDLIVKRGLYDFATVCDESNNTPDRIDRNEMYIDVAVKPVKAAEFIFIPIRIVATGAEI